MSRKRSTVSVSYANLIFQSQQSLRYLNSFKTGPSFLLIVKTIFHTEAVF